MAGAATSRFRWKRILGYGALATLVCLAVPAIAWYQKIHSAREQSIITCNLAQLLAAGEQFCAEQKKDVATYDDVVGPGKWIATLKSVAGEDYRGIQIRPGQALSISTPDGRTFSCQPGSPR